MPPRTAPKKQPPKTAPKDSVGASILRGLEDAVAFRKGDTTRVPKTKDFNALRNPDNAGMAKRLAADIGKIGTIQTQFPRLDVRVKVLDVKISYGRPLWLVETVDHPGERRWTPGVTFPK